MAISFEGAFIDIVTDEVGFHALRRGSRILCRVTSEALQDYTGAGTDWTRAKALAAFHKNQTRIEEVATRLIEKGRHEEEGSVLITFDRLRFGA